MYHILSGPTQGKKVCGGLQGRKEERLLKVKFQDDNDLIHSYLATLKTEKGGQGYCTIYNVLFM